MLHKKLTPESWRQYLYLYDLFEEKIDRTIPKNIKGAARNFIRIERYTVRTRKAFLTIPKAERPLYAILDAEKIPIPIKECREEAVHLQPFFKNKGSEILCVPDHTPYGAVHPDLYLRKTAAERLIKAEKKLHKILGTDYTFKVTDGLRPIALQRKYFQQAKKTVREQEGLTGQALYERVTHLIADPDHCPPHSTGGAVDLTIINKKTGKELDMGTSVDAIENATLYMIYMWHPYITEEARKNRLILYTVMVAAGFTNLPIEWWHYSYGDQEWALLKGKKAAIYDSYKK